MSGLINVNEQSSPFYASLPSYSSLRGSTLSPNAPVKVINQNDAPFRTFVSAFDAGLLNPNQNAAALAGRGYYTIATAYGKEPTSLYSVRGCTM